MDISFHYAYTASQMPCLPGGIYRNGNRDRYFGTCCRLDQVADVNPVNNRTQLPGIENDFPIRIPEEIHLIVDGS